MGIRKAQTCHISCQAHYSLYTFMEKSTLMRSSNHV